MLCPLKRAGTLCFVFGLGPQVRVPKQSTKHKALSTKSGEPNGRADSITRLGNADAEEDRRVSRGPLRLSKRQTLTALLSNAPGFSLLRHRSRTRGRVEPQVSTRKGHLQSTAEDIGYQSEFGRNPCRLR